MRKSVFSLLAILIFVFSVFAIKGSVEKTNGAPPYGVAEEDVPAYGTWEWIEEWERPKVPTKVALQVGHYLNDDLPDELEKLRTSDGATGGGKSEWEVNLAIAEATAEILEENGVEVDILPATVPPEYWADAFVAIHADGSTDSSKRGFKIAPPWRDYTDDAKKLTDYLYETYAKATGFGRDDNITRNMRGYYAFSWWKFDHAIHPMTTAVIVETGFLTNWADRQTIVNHPGTSAKGIADGIIKYLESENLLTN